MSLFLQNLDPDSHSFYLLDPDPHSEKLLDPASDPQKMNADPQPCFEAWKHGHVVATVFSRAQLCQLPVLIQAKMFVSQSGSGKMKRLLGSRSFHTGYTYQLRVQVNGFQAPS